MSRGGARPNSGPKKGSVSPAKGIPSSIRLPAAASRITSREALQELAREYSGEAVMVAVKLMRGKDTGEQVRLNAVKEIIDRAWGKAAPVIEVPGSGGIIVNIVQFSEEDDPPQIEHEAPDG